MSVKLLRTLDQCGLAMNDMPGTREEVFLSWETRIRLLTSANVWFSMLTALGIPSGLLGILMAFVAENWQLALIVPLVAMAFLFGIYIVVALFIDAFGGLKATFVLTTAGVRSLSGKGAKAVSNTALVAGILAGNPAVAGAGLLAKSEQNVFIRWEDIHRIKVRPGQRFVTIRGGWPTSRSGFIARQRTFPR